jgi:PncC family amidohydrolase
MSASWQETVVAITQQQRPWKSLALAESCTGGLLGATITAQPGVSAWFKGAVVAYDNRIKAALLGVPSSVLEEFGAVSEQCALHMSRGARQQLDAQVGLAITGIAGPEGGSDTKPVGLVYIAISDYRHEHCAEFHFSGDRLEIRTRAVTNALSLLKGWDSRF